MAKLPLDQTSLQGRRSLFAVLGTTFEFSGPVGGAFPRLKLSLYQAVNNDRETLGGQTSSNLLHERSAAKLLRSFLYSSRNPSAIRSLQPNQIEWIAALRTLAKDANSLRGMHRTDAPGAMSIENRISCRQIHTTLSLGLFAACAANMVLFCAFL